MKVLGVTGGIGMGKSACASLLRELQVPVVDTDDLARELVGPGQPALTEIAAAFGPGILDQTGALRRRELGKRVFTSSDDRRKLEAILHPKIRERWRGMVQEWRAQNRPVAAVIIPLLFETGAEAELDAILCVACSERTQRERLAPRGWSAEEISRRMAAQLPIAEKMSRSTFVVWSEGSMDLHRAQLQKILARLALTA
jgi:dephospho-CoA kinase